jgi:cytochrome b6-f complex iron-sulfur subunit
VAYQPEQKRIFCACHGGVYDANSGKNISGPPPEPLDVYKVLVEKDGVFVEKA